MRASEFAPDESDYGEFVEILNNRIDKERLLKAAKPYLTPRQMYVVQELLNGTSKTEIARDLGITLGGVEGHRIFGLGKLYRVAMTMGLHRDNSYRDLAQQRLDRGRAKSGAQRPLPPGLDIVETASAGATSSGGIATVAAPMGMQTRNGGSFFSGKYTNEPFPNTPKRYKKKRK